MLRINLNGMRAFGAFMNWRRSNWPHSVMRLTVHVGNDSPQSNCYGLLQVCCLFLAFSMCLLFLILSFGKFRGFVEVLVALKTDVQMSNVCCLGVTASYLVQSIVK